MYMCVYIYIYILFAYMSPLASGPDAPQADGPEASSLLGGTARLALLV